jgi:ribose 5-phosphate isomerase A
VREKIVAHASRRVIIVVDEYKLVEKLGSKSPIPIEVVPFSVDTVRSQLLRWGGEARTREKDGRRFVSDNGNLIVDWQHGIVAQPQILEKQLKAITGVVDSGLFAQVADLVIVAGPSGIRKLQRPT